jgi:hypothetical protein
MVEHNKSLSSPMIVMCVAPSKNSAVPQVLGNSDKHIVAED